MIMAIALAILDRALSKGLAPVGTPLPFDIVQVHLEAEVTSHAGPSETLRLPQQGDRLNLTVQHHAKLATGDLIQETSSFGYLVARKNECLIAFPAQSQIRGYRTTTISASLAAWYYDLRGGLLLLGHETDNPSINSNPPETFTSNGLNRNENSQYAQKFDPSMSYLLLDSRWCTWLKVHEGMAIAWKAVE